MEHIGTNKVKLIIVIYFQCHMEHVNWILDKKVEFLMKFGDINANQGLTDRSFLTLLISFRCVN